MKEVIKMKKINIVAITAVLFFMFLIPVFADDTADLQKLQPLSSLEQSMYEKVKNDATELHRFIVTRMYVRTVKQVIKNNNLKEDVLSKFNETDWDKLPPIPEGFIGTYCDSFSQGIDLMNLQFYQDNKKNTK
jgi:hypothetical protein